MLYPTYKLYPSASVYLNAKTAAWSTLDK
jgi:hypothetical protein